MDGSVEYRVLTEVDHDQVWDIVMTVYRTRDPLMTISEFSEEDMKNILGNCVKKCLIQRVSLGAFDKVTKKLVAACLNLLGKHETNEDRRESRAHDLPLTVKQRIASVEYFKRKNNAATFGARHYMYYAILCCRPEYGRRGIATELCRRSEEIARKEGCKIILIIASSAFTQKIARKLGFVAKESYRFSDYVDQYTGEKIFENVPEPHTVMTLEVKDLFTRPDE